MDIKQQLITMAQTNRTGKTALMDAVKLIDQLEDRIEWLEKELEKYERGGIKGIGEIYEILKEMQEQDLNRLKNIDPEVPLKFKVDYSRTENNEQ